jgi:PAS domain S-box-containing protein
MTKQQLQDEVNRLRDEVARMAQADVQRRQVEEVLRKSEEFHRLISEIASDYAYDCIVDADNTIRLVAMTEGFTRVTGFTVDEINSLGGWQELIHPEDLPLALERMPDTLKGEKGVHELRIITRLGTVRWIRYTTRPIWDEAAGRVVRLLGAVQDITEHKRDQQQLQDYAQRLQALSRRLLEVQEGERRHLARELHDEIGQALTGLKLALEMAGALSPAELGPQLQDALALVRDLSGKVRDLSLGLRPTLLDDLGLLPALLWQIERYTQQTKVAVHFQHHGLNGRLPAEVETAAFRIVQEALTNTARHSGVLEASVDVYLDRDTLHLRVTDRGRGFDPRRLPAGGATSGLSGMHERAELVGGRLEVEARPGVGTRLTAQLPVPSSNGVAANGAAANGVAANRAAFNGRTPDALDSVPGG